MRTILVCSALAVALAGSTAIAAQTTTSGHAASQTSSSAATHQVTDAQFVSMASMSGMAEVSLGKLASTQGHSAQVKEFGERMIRDHSAANQKLGAIASRKGMTVATMPKPADDAAARRLKAMSGAAFDTAYANKMVMDHQKAVALFQSETQRGTDPDLRAFAKNTLPTLEQHLDMARKLPGASADGDGVASR